MPWVSSADTSAVVWEQLSGTTRYDTAPTLRYEILLDEEFPLILGADTDPTFLLSDTGYVRL